MNVGDLVTCRQTGTQAWICRAKDPYGRWLLIGKGFDRRGARLWFGRQAGEGDLQLVTPRPSYEVGALIEHEGLACPVVSDDGDFVTLAVPEHSAALKHGGNLRVPPGVVEVSKSDIVVEALE